MLIKILLNDAFLKGTAEINEFSFAFPLDVFQLVVHTLRWTLLPFFSLNALTNGSRLFWKNAHGCPPTKGVDTGPSCKELRFWKYNCFSFDLNVYRLILNWHIGRVWETDPRPSSPVGNFLAQNKL